MSVSTTSYMLFFFQQTVQMAEKNKSTAGEKSRPRSLLQWMQPNYKEKKKLFIILQQKGEIWRPRVLPESGWCLCFGVMRLRWVAACICPLRANNGIILKDPKVVNRRSRWAVMGSFGAALSFPESHWVEFRLSVHLMRVQLGTVRPL